MSGIYIPNVKLPLDGVVVIYSSDRILKTTQVIAVPDHGRLVDADELRQDWLENGENEYVYDTNSFLYSIDDAPTIIEADKEEK